MPDTVTGNPARSAAVRPIVCWEPCGSAEPMMQSSISSGSTFERDTAARIACAAKVGAGVALKAPR